MLNFSNGDTEFPMPNCAAWVCVRGVPEVKKKKIDKLIVAMPLPKQGKKKICNNCGNGIAENGGKKSGFEIWGRVKKKKLSCPQYFYNIFTINHT